MDKRLREKSAYWGTIAVYMGQMVCSGPRMQVIASSTYLMHYKAQRQIRSDLVKVFLDLTELDLLVMKSWVISAEPASSRGEWWPGY